MNENNPVVRKMLADDEEDADGLGVVGFASDTLTTEAVFWKLVVNLHLPPSEVDKWTLEEMRLASAYMDMQADYRRIWSPYFDMKKGNE